MVCRFQKSLILDFWNCKNIKKLVFLSYLKLQKPCILQFQKYLFLFFKFVDFTTLLSHTVVWFDTSQPTIVFIPSRPHLSRSWVNFHTTSATLEPNLVFYFSVVITLLISVMPSSASHQSNGSRLVYYFRYAEAPDMFIFQFWWFPDWFYYRRSDGAPVLSIISSDGVPDLLTDFISVGLLIRLPRDHLSDQQFMTAARWESRAWKKISYALPCPLCMSLRHLRCVPVFQTPKTFCDHFCSPLGAFRAPLYSGHIVPLINIILSWYHVTVNHL